jgi:hypothetical protein
MSAVIAGPAADCHSWGIGTSGSERKAKTMPLYLSKFSYG